MQIPFNQGELSPLLYQIYVLFVQCVAVSAYLRGITVTKKKGIELRIFYYVNFFARAKYGRIVFLPDKTVIKQIC